MCPTEILCSGRFTTPVVCLLGLLSSNASAQQFNVAEYVFPRSAPATIQAADGGTVNIQANDGLKIKQLDDSRLLVEVRVLPDWMSTKRVGRHGWIDRASVVDLKTKTESSTRAAQAGQSSHVWGDVGILNLLAGDGKHRRQAVDSFTRALAINPKDASLLSFRAATYLVLGEYQKAIDDLEEEKRLEPNDHTSVESANRLIAEARQLMAEEAAAEAGEDEPGFNAIAESIIRVTAESAEIKNGEKTVAEIPRGTRLYVIRVKDGKRAYVKAPNSNDRGYLDLALVVAERYSAAESAKLGEGDLQFTAFEQARDESNYEVAARHREAGLKAKREVLNSDPAMAMFLSISAHLYDLPNDGPDVAIGYLEEALEIEERWMGTDSKDAASTRLELISRYLKDGDLEKAAKLSCDACATSDVYLIDLAKRKRIPVERDAAGVPKLQQRRVYMFYAPQLEAWVYTVTLDEEPVFAWPPRMLMPKSQLPGEWVGASEKVAYEFVGPPAKGPDQFRQMPRGDSNRKYSFANFNDPRSDDPVSVTHHRFGVVRTGSK